MTDIEAALGRRFLFAGCGQSTLGKLPELCESAFAPRVPQTQSIVDPADMSEIAFKPRQTAYKLLLDYPIRLSPWHCARQITTR